MHEPMADPAVFRMRLITSGGVAAGLIAFSLLTAWRAITGWRDRGLVGLPLQRVMIMGGMGPVGRPPRTGRGQALRLVLRDLLGVMLLASVGVLLTPGVHA